MKDFTYDIERGQTPYILSAVIGADSFFYGLFDKDYDLYSCVYLEDVVFDSHFAEQMRTSLTPYRDVKHVVSFSTKPFLHVPVSEEDIAKFYPAFDDKSINAEKFTATDIKVIYGLSDDQVSFVEQVFSNANYHHLSTVLNNVSYPSRKDKLLLHVEHNRAHILCSDTDKLRYYNQFECHTREDYLYFTLMAYDVLGLDPQTVPLEVSGRVEESSAIHDLLLGYVNHIQFSDSKHFKVADLRFRKSKHYYYDLYSTAICG